MARKELHIVQDRKRGWDVRTPHAEGAPMHFDTKEDAIEYARGGCIVAMRGFVIPLEKGKEGIHKKFDEILNASANCK